MSKYIYIIAVLFFHTIVIAQERQAAFEMNERLGRGINIGNTFEAPSENAWSNPWNHKYARIIDSLGFNHVRIPINWDTDSRTDFETPFNMNPMFFERIQEVVDTLLSYGLHVIINMHHHHDLFYEPDDNKDRFLAQWYKIGEFFKDYPDSLLFEVLNEPNGELTPQKWNELFSEALEQIRITNPNRMVLMGTADWGGLGALPLLELPDDSNIIVTVHYYNPFTFTHQGASWVGDGTESDAWIGTKWRDTQAEREAIDNDFQYAFEFREDKNVPIHVGEFGAYSQADMQSRVRWTTYLARWFEMQEFSWAYWEFSAGFGIYNRSTGEIYQELADALLRNSIPEPTVPIIDTIYSSSFEDGNDGWIIVFQDEASGELLNDDGVLNVKIDNIGSNRWHVQLLRSGLSLKKNRIYRYSFNASAPQSKIVNAYIGKSSSPYTAYSGYNSVMIEPEATFYSTTFNMSSSDSRARAVFDLGDSDIDFYLYSFVVEELYFEDDEVYDTDEEDDETPAIIKELYDDYLNDQGWNGLKVYPNPIAEDYLYITNSDDIQKIVLYNNEGKVICTKLINSQSLTLNFNGLPHGVYILKLYNDYGFKAIRLLKF